MMTIPCTGGQMLPPPQITTETFGAWFAASKHARPYRHKNRAARTNDRTGNKRKIHQFTTHKRK